MGQLHTHLGATAPQFETKAVCFTDLPLRFTEQHSERYGCCAIGVTKSRVKQWGGNPVLYIVDRRNELGVSDSELHNRRDLRGIFGEYLVKAAQILAQSYALNDDHWSKSLSPEQLEELKKDFGFIFAYVKEMFDLGADVDGEDDPNKDRYFLEREWRVGLTHTHEAIGQHNSPDNFVRQDPDGNYYLTLRKEDVRVIVLPNDWSRKEIARRLIDKGWPPHELPTLITYSDSRNL